MKSDIRSRADIETLINSFYDKVKSDTTIGFFFSDVVPVNWETHMPIMYNFWESILFGSNNYKGEPMTIHKHLSGLHRMEPAHFERWVMLFEANARELFEGEKTEEIIARAKSIASIMQWKVNN